MTSTRGPVLLVLRALGLGDLLTGVPALRGLRRHYPEHRLVLATAGWLRPLASLAGLADAVVPAGELEAVRFDVPEVDVDVAVNLHGRGPESHRILQAMRPARLVAFANDAVPGTGELPRWRAREHEVHRWCRLLTECGIAADPADLRIARPLPPDASLWGATVIHPGAKAAARRWPVERWAAVAAHETAQGRHVVVTGNRGEIDLACAVGAGAGLPRDAVLAGRLDVAELAGLVGVAGCVLAGDTGVAHLATALSTPSVVLFGPTPPSEWGPPLERTAHRALWRGRRGAANASEPDPGLLAITVDDVLAVRASLLTAGAVA